MCTGPKSYKLNSDKIRWKSKQRNGKQLNANQKIDTFFLVQIKQNTKWTHTISYRHYEFALSFHERSVSILKCVVIMIYHTHMSLAPELILLCEMLYMLWRWVLCWCWTVLINVYWVTIVYRILMYKISGTIFWNIFSKGLLFFHIHVCHWPSTHSIYVWLGGYSSMIWVGTCRWDLKSRPIFIPNFAETWDPFLYQSHKF